MVSVHENQAPSGRERGRPVRPQRQIIVLQPEIVADGTSALPAADESLGQVDRVPNERERAPGLAAMLRAKSEKDDPALAHRHFG